MQSMADNEEFTRLLRRLIDEHGAFRAGGPGGGLRDGQGQFVFCRGGSCESKRRLQFHVRRCIAAACLAKPSRPPMQPPCWMHWPQA